MNLKMNFPHGYVIINFKGIALALQVEQMLLKLHCEAYFASLQFPPISCQPFLQFRTQLSRQFLQLNVLNAFQY